ncbi:MAG: acyl-CoA dehydrogenase family protein [Pyrinomonadaceae bacterium]|nr:acyl-CoA dehydrogenase family protein [Phycisphaerales bacterium]
MADIKNLKNIPEKDRKLIEEAEALMGPEPTSIGFTKNLFWGNFREELCFPYPAQDPKEIAECDQLLARLDEYLHNEHPAILIDQEQEIPRWVIDRLFQLGVLGMTISKEYGGLGMGITSYNRVLERIGHSCGSTAVLVSAHQSIGCKSVMLFGTDEQKKRWLPHLCKDWVSAFCLSEPNVGCDAGGQETRCERSADGEHYIINGEKKWATSGAIASLFTVMTKQRLKDETGKDVDKITALVCTPDMEGIEILQKNRSKCGIRGTWQARIRFHNVKVPKANLMHKEGQGLKVALSCLNYGRCTLSAGMLGGARKAMDQSIKWSQTRFQFQRPLSDWELVRKHIANMAALTYAMDAVLYMTTGMLDRKDEDIMVETAVCKVFCSEMGWRCVNDAVQIMGGESYMTENEIERIFRDSRINLIVEGSNDLMQGFIFGYGGKKLAESMLTVKDAVGWNKDEPFGQNVSRILTNGLKPAIVKAALPLGLELYLGMRRKAPHIKSVHPSLRSEADRLCRMIREHSHQLKQTSKRLEEALFSRQSMQARLADMGMYLHAWACTLSKLDADIRHNGGNADGDTEFQRDKAAALHFFDLCEMWINHCIRELYENPDDSMLTCAAAALKHNDTLPNSEFSIPERSPIAAGTGKKPKQDGIKQFPGNAYAKAGKP